MTDAIFELQFASRAKCAALLKRINKLDRPKDGPNSMNKYGRIIYGRELREEMAEIVASIVAPEALRYGIVPKKYPYAFTVEYDVKKQRSLATHFDSSDITLNICLAGDFDGGDVIFYPNRNERIVVKNEVGHAILHSGTLEHRATPLTRGTRANLILWCTAKKGKWRIKQ